MNCQEFSNKVSDYVEDRLPFGEKVGMWLHAIICPACKRYQKQIEWVIKLAGDTSGDEEAEPACPEGVKSDLVDQYAREFGDESPQSEGSSEP